MKDLAKFQSSPVSSRRLDMMPWLAAWDNYILAAVCLHQLTHQEAVQHKARVLEVTIVCVLIGRDGRRVRDALPGREHVRLH